MCETWVVEDGEPKLNNYSCYFWYRGNTEGGGLTILIRNEISSTTKNVNIFAQGQLEVKVVSILRDDGNFDTLNLHNPGI